MKFLGLLLVSIVLAFSVRHVQLKSEYQPINANEQSWYEKHIMTEDVKAVTHDFDYFLYCYDHYNPYYLD